MEFNDLFHFAQLFALLALIPAKKYMNKKTFLCFFVLLLTVNLVEWGNHFKLFSINHANNWIYNIFNPLWFAIISWLYFNVFNKPSSKTTTIVLYAAFFLLTIINIIWVEGLRYFNSYTYILGCCIMVYFAYIYFREMIDNVDEIPVYKKMFFWFSVAVIFFYTGEAILWSFFQYFLITNNFKSFQPTFHLFSSTLNIMYYSLLSIAFFCKQP